MFGALCSPVPVPVLSACGEALHRSAWRVQLGTPSVADIVDGIVTLADDGLGLVAATYRLATDLWQQLGVAETLQFTSDGMLELPYCLESRRHAVITAWAVADASTSSTK
jgi:hypothetical protein